MPDKQPPSQPKEEPDESIPLFIRELDLSEKNKDLVAQVVNNQYLKLFVYEILIKLLTAEEQRDENSANILAKCRAYARMLKREVREHNIQPKNRGNF